MRFLFQDESVDDVTSVAGYGNLNVWFGFLLLFGVGGVLYPFCTCCAAACMSEDSSAGAASAANPALAGLTSRSRCRRAYAVFGIIIAFVFRLLALIAGSIWFEEDGQLSAKQVCPQLCAESMCQAVLCAGGQLPSHANRKNGVFHAL